MLCWKILDTIFFLSIPICICFLLYKITKSLYLEYKLDIILGIVNLKLSSINVRSTTYKEDIRDIVEYVNVECNKIDGLGADLCKNKNQINGRFKICYNKISFFLM